MSIYYVVLANKLAGLEVLQRDFISLSAGHYMKTSTTPCMGHNKTAFIITMIKYHHTHTHRHCQNKSDLSSLHAIIEIVQRLHIFNYVWRTALADRHVCIVGSFILLIKSRAEQNGIKTFHYDYFNGCHGVTEIAIATGLTIVVGMIFLIFFILF